MARYTKKQINEIADILHKRYMLYEMHSKKEDSAALDAFGITKKALAVLDIASDLSYYFANVDSNFGYKQWLERVINGNKNEAK